MTRPSQADLDAAAAARGAEPVPEALLVATPIGECECGARFWYRDPEAEVGQLDPCPECGAFDWRKWGYELPDGREIPADEIEEVDA